MSVGLYAIEQMRIFFIQEIIDKYAYTVIEPIGSKPGVLHGWGKNHKETKVHRHRVILSVITTTTYKRAK